MRGNVVTDQVLLQVCDPFFLQGHLQRRLVFADEKQLVIIDILGHDLNENEKNGC